MQTALILIDIQNDYFPGGKMELVDMEIAARNASQLLQRFRNNKLPIFHVKHISKRPNATFFIPGTLGVEINDSVKPNANEVVINKHYPNSFRETNLHELLMQNNITKLMICGAMSHMCIDATTRAAFDLGYQSTIISDACATKNLSIYGIDVSARQVHAAFMASLHGLFAHVGVSSDELNKCSVDY